MAALASPPRPNDYAAEFSDFRLNLDEFPSFSGSFPSHTSHDILIPPRFSTSSESFVPRPFVSQGTFGSLSDLHDVEQQSRSHGKSNTTTTPSTRSVKSSRLSFSSTDESNNSSPFSTHGILRNPWRMHTASPLRNEMRSATESPSSTLTSSLVPPSDPTKFQANQGPNTWYHAQDSHKPFANPLHSGRALDPSQLTSRSASPQLPELRRLSETLDKPAWDTFMKSVLDVSYTDEASSVSSPNNNNNNSCPSDRESLTPTGPTSPKEMAIPLDPQDDSQDEYHQQKQENEEQLVPDPCSEMSFPRFQPASGVEEERSITPGLERQSRFEENLHPDSPMGWPEAGSVAENHPSIIPTRHHSTATHRTSWFSIARSRRRHVSDSGPGEKQKVEEDGRKVAAKEAADETGAAKKSGRRSWRGLPQQVLKLAWTVPRRHRRSRSE